MATVSMRSLLFNIAAVNFHVKSQNWPPSLSKTTTPLSIPTLSKSSIKPLSIARRRISPHASADTASEVDNQTDEASNEGENVQEEVMEIRADNAPKRLKKDEGRLYVGNLPFSTTSHELAELFSQAGTVISADVLYNRVTERSRGFGFVKMASKEAAEAAIQMFNESHLGGRIIKVNFPQIPRGAEREVQIASTRPSRGYVDTAHKLYAGNIGWGVTSETLKKSFSHLDGLLGAKVIYDRETGLSKGYGFVTFASVEEASAALESMDGVEVEGRPLRLNLAGNQKRDTYMKESAMETPASI